MKELRSNLTYISLYHFLLGICSFLLSYSPKLIPIGFILVFIIAIFGLIKKKAQFVFPNKLMIAFILLYIFYVVGTLFTNNLPLALNYLEYKLSFLLIPLIFLIRPKESISLFSVSVGLIIGIIITAITSFINGIQCYNEIDYFLECFTSSYLTSEHPTYFAVYLTLAIALSWYGWINNFRFFKISLVILFNIIAFSMLFLGLSLSGILFALFAIGIIILILINRKWGKLVSLSTLIGAPLLMALMFFSVPSIKSDMLSSFNSFKAFFQNPDEFLEFDGEHNGDDVRLIMWSVTTQEFMEHPFGVGTGNVDYFLSKRLKKYHQMEMAKMDDTKQILYNPHNQFLQTGLEIGVFGLLILLFIVIYSIRKSIQDKNWILLILASNLAFNCLFESMLQRQSGLVFFTFWLILLSISGSVEKKKENG